MAPSQENGGSFGPTTVDHYFLVNDGPERSVVPDFRGIRYASCEDAVTGESLAGEIPLPAHGARWLRLERCPKKNLQ